jgi:hypothetical protein
MAAKKKMFSLSELNVVKKCEEAVEFEVLDNSGKGMDVFISVIGGHAPVVQNMVNKLINHRRRVALAQSKRGKAEDFTPIEEDINFAIEMAIIRMTGWRNITEEFTKETATELCTINPEIRKQVIDVSEALANLKGA